MQKTISLLSKIFIVALVLFGTVYYSFNMIMSAIVHEKAEVLVPDLKGKTLNESLTILLQSKLVLLKEGTEFSQDVPAGTVIRQVPAAGMNVKEGKTVKVTMSQGGESVYIPNLVGQTIRATNISLRSLGLILGELSKKASIKYDEGIVLGQDPIAGTTVGKDTAVNILVSNGVPTDGSTLMIDWVGQGADFAKEWATKGKYDVDIVEQTTKSANPGQVFDQFPKPDELLTKNTKIIFYVADKKSKLLLDDKKFTYTIPSKGESKRVRLVLCDDTGEKDIFNGIKKAGSKISVSVKTQGKATVKVFLNNVSIEDISL